MTLSIRVMSTDDGIAACFSDDINSFGEGRTMSEAIGNLVLRYGKMRGVECLPLEIKEREKTAESVPFGEFNGTVCAGCGQKKQACFWFCAICWDKVKKIRDIHDRLWQRKFRVDCLPEYDRAKRILKG